MTVEEKIIVDQCDPVNRMGVYEFLEKDGTMKNLCIVVGADHRKHDRFVSIVMLKDAEEQNGHPDSVGIRLPIGDYWVNCGMVTYCRRDRLGKKLCKVGDGTRKRISKMIGIELGVINAERETVWQIKDVSEEERQKEIGRLKGEVEHWKSLYNGLLGVIRMNNTAKVAHNDD